MFKIFKLRYNADVKTLIYMAVTSLLFVGQWFVFGFNPVVYFVYLFMSVSVAVIVHNHNHLPIWLNKNMNIATDSWLTVFYGFPVFAWIPTHNKNHHRLNNKEGDYTITYRFSEKNNFITLLTYPSISGFYQQKAIKEYLKEKYNLDRTRFYQCIWQYVILIIWTAAFLLLDWRKALLFVVVPQQVALFSVLIFNYVQHVHANEESKFNHSRNFTGALNQMLFNNGLHTVHHDKAGLHWSKVPEEHYKMEHNIDDSLKEKSFWGYIFKAYVLGLFNKKYKTDSMRLRRIEEERIHAHSVSS